MDLRKTKRLSQHTTAYILDLSFKTLLYWPFALLNPLHSPQFFRILGLELSFVTAK